MGCNTSKESAVPQESENKDNQENQERSATDQDTNIKEHPERDNDINHVTEPSEKESKSVSAKTITLPANGSAKSIHENKTPTSESPPGNTKESERSATAKDKVEAEEAATKIQAVFRGHKTRKSMKQPGQPQQQHQPEQEPTQEELENEFRSDDEELCNAATKIQASFRGHMTRKNIDKKDEKDIKEDKQGTSGGDEELDIDLTDPELNKAATKIQATFRGHVTRKEQDAPKAE